MPETAKKEYYSWQEYDRDVRAMAKTLTAQSNDFDNIYGLPRGGLVLAVSLSHRLNKPLIFDSSEITSRTLLVDDIIETGGTLKRLVAEFKIVKPLIAALYYNQEKSAVIPTIFARQQTKWVVFPWETESSSKYDHTI